MVKGVRKVVVGRHVRYLLELAAAGAAAAAAAAAARAAARALKGRARARALGPGGDDSYRAGQVEIEEAGQVEIEEAVGAPKMDRPTLTSSLLGAWPALGCAEVPSTSRPSSRLSERKV